MIIKDILDESFQDYKLPSMYIAMPYCTWKCCIESHLPEGACQNFPLAKQKNIDIETDTLIKRYINNTITKAIVFAGLEPMLSFNDVLEFTDKLRYKYNCEDDVVIYTGYYENEIQSQIDELSKYKNIVVKFGRYIPNVEGRYDELLGVKLISSNQYARRIS